MRDWVEQAPPVRAGFSGRAYSDGAGLKDIFSVMKPQYPALTGGAEMAEARAWKR
ncbi:MAG TPA: hypothetical protein VH639_13990 [Bryobacteraceae bacterium]|jgi:hypothetical protein